MKFLMQAVLLSLFSLSAFAGNAMLTESQRDILKDMTTKYKETYKCPVQWTFDEKSVDFTSDLERSKFGTTVGAVEYEIRLKCQSDSLKGKITKVNFSCGKTDTKYSPCPEAALKDGVTVKLSGSTLNVTGKYKNCYCGEDMAQSETKKHL